MAKAPALPMRATTTLPLVVLAGALAACSSSDDSNDTTPTTTVSGSVLNSPTRVGGVEVTLTGAGGTFNTTTSNQGTYSIDNVPVGSYTFTFDGDGVFDDNGDPIADKIDLELRSVSVTAGDGERKPTFLPERPIGFTVDTSGTNTGTIPAGTLLESNGVTVFFAAETTVTFPDANDTTLSIVPVPSEQIPQALPNGLAASALVAIEPAGATFDVRPQIDFENDGLFPSGVAGIRIFRLDFQTGAWVLSGTGTTSADGARILSGAGQGLAATGWHAIVVDTFCETEVVGTVTTNSGQPIEGAVVTSLNGVTGTTDAAGRFALAGVPLPSNGFDVLVTVAPPAGGGFEADESGDHPGECGATTDIGTVRLDTVATDAVAPTVASTSPASDATDVADNAAVSITFDETMSTGSLNGDTLGLFLGDDAVAGFIGVSTSLGQTTATFVPSAPLETGSEYRFRVTTEAMDAFGNGLDEAFEFTFTTEADATGGTVTVDVTPDSPSGGFPGITETLSAAVTDAAGNTVAGATVTWTTSDPSVAEIDATGVVTTLAPGTTTIRGTFGDAFDEVTYSVSTPVADSVTLTAGTTALAAGTSLALVATARDSSSNPLDGFDFAWTSSDETIATVDAAGVVRGVLAGGPVTITATEQFSGQSANVAITVIDPTAVDAVTVTAETDAIGPDVSLQMEAVAFDSMQAAIPGVTFTWSSSNTSIATVSATGAVTAVGSGTVAIQATAVGSTDVTGTTDLDVYAFEPTVIRFELGDSTALGSPQLDVVLHDAATGQSLDGLSTDSDLTVDFGFVDVERVHVTFYESQFLPSPRGDSGPTAYTTVMDLPRGRRTLNYTPNPGSAIEFDASFPVGVDTITASSGDDVEGTLVDDSVSQSPEDIFFLTRVFSSPAILAAGYDSTSTSAGIVAGAFVDSSAELAGRGVGLSGTLSSENVQTATFTSGTPVTFVESRFRRQGRFYRQSSGVTAASTSGSMSFFAPNGTERYGYTFESLDPATFSRLRQERRFDALPESVGVELASLGLDQVDFNANAGTLDWSLTGASTSSLDVGRAVLTSEYGFGRGGPLGTWEVIFPATRTTITLPVAKGLPQFTSDRVEFSLEFFDQEGVNGYDTFVSRMSSEKGVFGATTLDEGGRLDSIAARATAFDFFISSGTFGTVSYDLGHGPVTVANNERVFIPFGVPVVLTATATTGGAFVGQFSTNQGNAEGVGTTTATITIDANDRPSDVSVSFAAN